MPPAVRDDQGLPSADFRVLARLRPERSGPVELLLCTGTPWGEAGA